MTNNFKEHVKIVKIYMVKFNVSILSRLKMFFFVNTEYIHKHEVISKGFCVSQPPALCLAHNSSPEFVFTSPGLQFVFAVPGP